MKTQTPALILILSFAVGIAMTEANEYQFTAEEQKEIDTFIEEYENDMQDGETLLHQATRYNKSIAIFQFLLSKGADVNAKNGYGKTAIMTDWLKIDIAKFLVANGADVHAKADNGETPLQCAVYTRNVEVAQFLISKGANVDTKDNDGKSPLHRAVWGHDGLCTTLLISTKADIHAKNNNGETPLHVAAQLNGNTVNVKILVAEGADVNLKNNDGRTPLHLVNKDTVAVTEFLVSKGADIHAVDKENETPLHKAVSYDKYKSKNARIEIVKFLISQGAKVNAKNKDGMTPLDLAKDAAIAGALARSTPTQPNVNLFRAMYETDVKTVDTESFALFSTGVHAQDVEVIKFLVSNGANESCAIDVNWKGKDDLTMLHRAASGGNIAIAQYLISKGANVNVKGNYGSTPLRLAVIRGRIKFVRFLIANGADVNSRDKSGDTSLHLALQGSPNSSQNNGTVEIAKLLIANGADVNVKNEDGMTPLDIAKERKQEAMIECLENLGAKSGK